jgi:hypothetical protein
MFLCDHCHVQVPSAPDMGVVNRNHCPSCLFSKHVDDTIPGDRKALCDGMMEPVGLTIKKSKGNKYKPEKNTGELMIIHRCMKCEKVNINRIAGDDDTNMILEVFAASTENNDIDLENISMLHKKDKKLLLLLLFGMK